MPTEISWANETWNPCSGCQPISPGCKLCYGRRLTARFGEKWGRKNGKDFSKVELHPDRLEQPLTWKKPRRVFVCSMSDLFHKDVPMEKIVFIGARQCFKTAIMFFMFTKD